MRAELVPKISAKLDKIMPVKITKLKGGKYSVRTPHGVKAKHTTKKNAVAQERLLNAVEHGFKPTHAKMKKRMMSKY